MDATINSDSRYEALQNSLEADPESLQTKANRSKVVRVSLILVLYAGVNVFSFTCSKLAYQEEPALTVLDQSLHRVYVSPLLALFFGLILRAKFYVVPREARFVVTMRCLATIAGMLSFFFAVKYLPLSTVSTLFNLNPIIIYFLEAFYFKVIAFLSRKDSINCVSASQ